MSRMLQVTLLVSAVALLAAAPAAAGAGAPICTGEAAPNHAVAGVGATPVDGAAPADLFAVAGAETTPEPQPLAGPIGPIEPPLCGNVVCPFGTRCCNPLCSACTPPGVECTLGDCGHGPSS